MQKKRNNRNRILAGITLVVLLAFLLWTFYLFKNYSPDEIVSIFQTKGAPAIILFSIFGGTSLTAFPLYSALIALSVGGMSIFYLAVLASIGNTCGDFVIYFLGYSGSKTLSEKNQKRVDRLAKFEKKLPAWAVPVFIVCYSTFMPFPNELMTASLGVIKYKRRKMILPLLVGNFLHFLVWILIGTGSINAIFG